MKLNKVLALALSGVMAVSMLAGCKGPATDEDSSSSEVVVTSDAVAIMNDAQDDIDFSSDAALDAALAAAVEKAKYNDIKEVKFDGKLITETTDGVYAAMRNKVLGITTTALADSSSYGKDLTAAESKTTKTVLYYVKSNGLSEEQALKNVVELMDTDAFKDSKIGSTNATYKAEYTGAVSVQKVTKTDSVNDKSASVYVIAVSVTQTVSKVADTGSSSNN